MFNVTLNMRRSRPVFFTAQNIMHINDH